MNIHQMHLPLIMQMSRRNVDRDFDTKCLKWGEIGHGPVGSLAGGAWRGADTKWANARVCRDLATARHSFCRLIERLARRSIALIKRLIESRRIIKSRLIHFSFNVN